MAVASFGIVSDATGMLLKSLVVVVVLFSLDHSPTGRHARTPRVRVLKNGFTLQKAEVKYKQ